MFLQVCVSKDTSDLCPLVVSHYPLSRPPSARPNRAIGRLRANPKTNMLSAVPARPHRRTGFRPTLSLMRPQATPEENSAKAKDEVTMPTYTANVRVSVVILKERIM